MDSQKKNQIKKILRDAGLMESSVHEDVSATNTLLASALAELAKPKTVDLNGMTLKGDKGDKPVAGVDYLIPENGKDYILTEKDKEEIASKIDVPIVEKVIEKTEVIHKQPIITQEIKEVAVTDSPLVIANKLNTLEQAIDWKVIKDAPAVKDIHYKDIKGAPKNPPLDFNDMRWHGGGLSTVSHDATLTGTGTPSSPLHVVGGPEDHLVAISATDTTPNYLNPKITVSGGLTKSITNLGGNEVLNIDASGVTGLPASPLTSIQFNNAGAFGGSKLLYTEPTTTLSQIEVKPATGTDTAGVGLQIDMGSSTGTADGGQEILRTTLKGQNSGSTANTYTKRRETLIDGSTEFYGADLIVPPITSASSTLIYSYDGITTGYAANGGNPYNGYDFYAENLDFSNNPIFSAVDSVPGNTAPSQNIVLNNQGSPTATENDTLSGSYLVNGDSYEYIFYPVATYNGNELWGNSAGFVTNTATAVISSNGAGSGFTANEDTATGTYVEAGTFREYWIVPYATYAQGTVYGNTAQYAQFTDANGGGGQTYAGALAWDTYASGWANEQTTPISTGYYIYRSVDGTPSGAVQVSEVTSFSDTDDSLWTLPSGAPSPTTLGCYYQWDITLPAYVFSTGYTSSKYVVQRYINGSSAGAIDNASPSFSDYDNSIWGADAVVGNTSVSDFFQIRLDWVSPTSPVYNQRILRQDNVAIDVPYGTIQLFDTPATSWSASTTVTPEGTTQTTAHLASPGYAFRGLGSIKVNEDYDLPDSTATANIGDVITYSSSGETTFVTPSTIATAVPLSGLTAATTSNTIFNVDSVQTWNWDSLSTTAMDWQSNSTTGTNNSKIFNILRQGMLSTSGVTTYGASIANKHNGTLNKNVALYLEASGGDKNYALITNGGFIGIGTATPTEDITFGGSVAREVAVEPSSAGTTGKGLTFRAGSVTSGTNLAGGQLVFASGQGTGTGDSIIQFKTATTVGSGTSLQSTSSKLTIIGNGNIGLGVDSPTNNLSFSNSGVKKIWIESTANTVAGRDLTIAAGSTVTAGTNNQAGGQLILTSGAGKGTGDSSIAFQTATTLASGNTLQTLSTKMQLMGTGELKLTQKVTSLEATGGSNPAFIFNTSGDLWGNSQNVYAFQENGVNFLTIDGIGNVQAPNGTINASNTAPESGVNAFVGQGMRRFSTTDGFNFAFGENITTDPGFDIFPIGGTFTTSGTLLRVSKNSARTSVALLLNGNGQLGIGITPTSMLTLPAGTATAGTAPLQFTSGTLLTVPVAGATEYLTDAYYGTTTTNTIRRMFVMGSTGRATGQTTANASVATYTLGATDASYEVSANVLVTTSSAEAFTVTCDYTDEGNTARTVTFNFSTIAGVLGTAINFANGAVPYEGIPLHIRCKASTAITIKTAAGGTYTGATYNVEGVIKQIA